MSSRGIRKWLGGAVIAIFVTTLLVSLNNGPAVVVREASSSFRESASADVPASAHKVLKRGNSPTVLFVVNTHENNYKTRVQDIRETYLPRVHEKSSLDLIFVSSQMTDGSADMFQSTCPMGYREDSCKRADMMTIAAGYLRRPGMEVLDWVFFLDDDAFILPDNVQRVIQEGIRQEKNLTTAFGINNCVHEQCRGICGGGGYYMNRETLFHVVNSGNKTEYPSIRDETEFYDKPCGRCGDLAIARVMMDFHGVPIMPFPLKGIYVWGIEGKNTDDDYKRSLQMTDPLPWLYHYPAKNRFKDFQKWADEFGSNEQLED